MTRLFIRSYTPHCLLFEGSPTFDMDSGTELNGHTVGVSVGWAHQDSRMGRPALITLEERNSSRVARFQLKRS